MLHVLEPHGDFSACRMEEVLHDEKYKTIPPLPPFAHCSVSSQHHQAPRESISFGSYSNINRSSLIPLNLDAVCRITTASSHGCSHKARKRGSRHQSAACGRAASQCKRLKLALGLRGHLLLRLRKSANMKLQTSTTH